MESGSQEPAISQSVEPVAEDSSELTTTEAGMVSNDVGAKETHAKSNDIQPKSARAKTLALMVSVLLSMFLVGLDRTIVTTAIPRITDDFDSFADIGWYGSAYLLTSCALQLLYGKVYTLFSIKAVLLANILLFEVASAICGAAPNSVAFIVGRALAGIGSAGVFAGVIICISEVVPLDKRPMYQAMFGALMGVASIAGPLIGGGFTSNVTWRWCFYINLPLGAVAMPIIFFCLDVPDRETTRQPVKKKLLQLDVIGTTLIVPGIICLLLALQWGGATYAWQNARIIALFTLAGVLIVAFTAVQILLPGTATLPARIVKQRSIFAGFWMTTCTNCGSYIVMYFLPIWFQAIKGVSAAESGIRTLPLMLSMIIGAIGGGVTNSKIGYYTPLAIIGSCIMSVGSGLLTTFEVNASAGKWIGYQVLYGFGLGMCFQVPNLAAQTCLPQKDVPTGLALMLFGSLMGAAVFVAVGENVLSQQLIQRLSWVPGFNAAHITSSGATSLLDALPADLRQKAFTEYNTALQKTLQVGIYPACLTVLGAAALEWRSVKKKPEAPADAEANGATAEKETGEKEAVDATS